MNISLLHFIANTFEFVAVLLVSLTSNLKYTLLEQSNIIGTNEVKEVEHN